MIETRARAIILARVAQALVWQAACDATGDEGVTLAVDAWLAAGHLADALETDLDTATLADLATVVEHIAGHAVRVAREGQS